MNSRELCMLEYVPEIIEASVGCLRIEAGMYDKDKQYLRRKMPPRKNPLISIRLKQL